MANFNLNQVRKEFLEVANILQNVKLNDDIVTKLQILFYKKTKKSSIITGKDGEQYKYCSKCEKLYHIDDFYKTSSMCKCCENVYNKMLNDIKKYKNDNDIIMKQMLNEKNNDKKLQMLQMYDDNLKQIETIKLSYNEKYKNNKNCHLQPYNENDIL